MINLNNLFKSSAVFAIFTFLSRILGMAREVIIAIIFGATGFMDAYLVAIKVPNFFRRLFAEGAFNQAFVPILAEYSDGAEAKDKALQHFIAACCGVIALVCFTLSIIGVFTSKYWIYLFAPGFIGDPAKLNLSAGLLMITFPYLGFICLAALASSVLNLHGKFGLPACTPVWLNICLICASVISKNFYKIPIYALAWGFLIGGVVQLLFLLPALAKIKCLVRPVINFKHEGVKKLLKLMLPACFGASVTQISLLMDVVFASFLTTGSISWLYYSDRLMQFPLGVFGVALGTVVLPTLSKQFVSNNMQGFVESLNWGCRWVFLLAIPCTVGLFLLATPILITLFNHGKFNVTDVNQASLSLKAFALGLLFFMLTKVLVSVYYSQKNIKTPVKYAVVCVATNILLNIIWVRYFAHVGIALASSVAALLNVLLLWRGLVKTNLIQNYFSLKWFYFTARVFISSVIMGGVIYLCDPSFDQWLKMHLSTQVLYLSGIIGASALVYFVSLKILGEPIRLNVRAAE